MLVFGEINKDNELHGRGMKIKRNGWIEIGTFKNGFEAGGTSYMLIQPNNDFQLGSYYLKEGGSYGDLVMRGRSFNPANNYRNSPPSKLYLQLLKQMGLV